MKQTEYGLFWRFADDHNPNHWEQLGKAQRNLELLRDMVVPEGLPTGVAWQEADKQYKIMQRSVVTSEWRNEVR